LPQNLFGLPLHILVVHAVVVLLPIAVVAAVAVAVWRRVRERFGPAVVGLSFVATLLVPIATQSGESLQAQLPSSPLIRSHAALGKALIPFAALFGIFLFALVALDVYARATADPRDLRGVAARLWARLPGGWRAERERPWLASGKVVASVLTVTFALAVGYLVVRAGHTGAKAVWDHSVRLSPGATSP
jgi:hypothetical protein